MRKSTTNCYNWLEKENNDIMNESDWHKIKEDQV